ncbi:MAG: 3-keto-disaccharide hydrolase [Rubripirellula sp.]
MPRLHLPLTGFLLVMTCLSTSVRADSPQTLFDGDDTEHWQFADGAWVIEDDGTLSCRMQEVKQKNGQVRMKGMGYIWTKEDFGDFELSLSYKLSEGCNSGVFYRSNPDDPVQQGFEIQLLDDAGFQKVKGPKDGKNLNGSFYDAKAASKDSSKPVGQWNDLKLTCHGPQVTVEINGVVVNEIDFDGWDTPMKNPDGSNNKFKTALKELPRTGRIGFQNHGQVVWFKDVVVKPL